MVLESDKNTEIPPLLFDARQQGQLCKFIPTIFAVKLGALIDVNLWG